MYEGLERPRRKIGTKVDFDDMGEDYIGSEGGTKDIFAEGSSQGKKRKRTPTLPTIADDAPPALKAVKCLAIEANALAAALCGRKQDLQEWKDEVFRIEKRIEDSSNQKDWMELELLEVKLEVKETRKLCRDVKMQRDAKQEELEAAMEELRALQEQELIASQQYLADASATE